MKFYAQITEAATACNFSRISPNPRLKALSAATRVVIADALLRSRRTPELGATTRATLVALGFDDLIARRGDA